MKKRILSLLICLLFAFSLNIVSASANDAEFQITPLIDYDNEKITITGVTPALYGQNVSITIYSLPTAISGMGDVDDRLNPEPQFPLAVNNIKKIKNVTADLEGKFSVTSRNPFVINIQSICLTVGITILINTNSWGYVLIHFFHRFK